MELGVGNSKPMRGRKFGHTAKDRVLSGNEPKGQEVFDRQWINGTIDVRMRQDRLQFRSEQQLFAVSIHIKRLLPQMISSQHQFTPASIPDGEREHASKMRAQIDAIVFVKMDENFRVRVCSERVSASFQLSPKFLIGESYGTTRSAQLSSVLQKRHQIYLNGVVLVSAVGFGNWGQDDRTIFFLPTFIMSAWYHKLLPPDLQKLSATELAQQARAFAHGEYAAALEQAVTTLVRNWHDDLRDALIRERGDHEGVVLANRYAKALAELAD